MVPAWKWCWASWKCCYDHDDGHGHRSWHPPLPYRFPAGDPIRYPSLLPPFFFFLSRSSYVSFFYTSLDDVYQLQQTCLSLAFFSIILSSLLDTCFKDSWRILRPRSQLCNLLSTILSPSFTSSVILTSWSQELDSNQAFSGNDFPLLTILEIFSDLEEVPIGPNGNGMASNWMGSAG